MERKTVLITGGARGIGLATAREFARAGYEIAIVDRDRAALAEAERSLGAKVTTHAVDVTDARAVEALAHEVLATFGHLDVLVNNAGIAYTGALASTTLATWRTLMGVNFFGPLHLISAFVPSMIARGAGTIVNVSSGQSFLRMPGWGAYATSKIALGGFSEILHHELRGLGVRVSTVYPFLVKNTGLYDDAKPKTARARLAMAVSMRLADTPEKVAHRVFEAATHGHRIDRVSALNDLGYYGLLVPPIAKIFGRTVAWLFEEKPATTGGRGFRIDETMSGDHAFEPGCGPAERQPMSFHVSWGPDDLRAWLAAGTTSPLALAGRVSVGGLVEDAPCDGTLELRYAEGRIRYTFEFSAAGRAYRFVGEKVNIRPWNLPTSHTTCFGRLVDAETGRLVSSSVLHFRTSTLPAFLGSFRLTPPRPAPSADTATPLRAVH